MVDSVGTLAGQASVADQTASGKAKSSLAADFDAFLLLLTTQLKNQDPLSPLKPEEFTGQLVQFAGVEQQIKVNDNLEKLTGIQNASLAASIIGFVGTNVEAEGSGLPLQDGKAKFTYDNSDAAKNVVITIEDADGNLVKTQAGERSAGLHEFTWDGKNNDGVLQPDGAYKVSVSPIGFDDEAITATVHTFARVTGVSLSDGTTLDASGVQIPLDKVIAVKEATTN